MERCTYIILVNWNGWPDTIECLESLFSLTDSAFRVVVCDNGSNDDSLRRIQRWAAGKQPASASDPSMAAYSSPARSKPVPCTRLTRDQAEQPGVTCDSRLVLIDCGENLGFAGGCNVGLRFVLGQREMAWAWLLNNDTVVDPAALSCLVEKMEHNPDAGIAGSTLVYYHQTDRIQALGGARYFPCLGLAMHIGRFRGHRRVVDEHHIERQMQYVMGASMFVTRKFIETVGLMSEEYFLYYEELDWALRARGKFDLAYAQGSLVFHKAGKSIGSSNKAATRSHIADYHLMRNRLRITQKFFHRYALLVRAFLCVEAVIRLLQGRTGQAGMIWRLATHR